MGEEIVEVVAIVTPTLDASLGWATIYAAKKTCGLPEIDVDVFVWDDHTEPRQRYTRTINTGLRLALETEATRTYQKRYNYICLLNDDCEPQTDNWLAELIRCFDFGGPMLGDGERIGYVAPGQPCRTVGMMESEGPSDEPQIRHIFAVPFGCVVIRREVFTDVGLLDPMFVHYASDTDHQYRSRSFGWQSVWAPHVWVHRESHPPMMDLWTQDRRAFEKRWGR